MMAEAAQRTPSSRRSSRKRKPKPTVLFVDDEQRVLNSMRALFRRDYEVFVTTEGSEAIEMMRENTIDVIVADQRMPEMTGVEVLGACKEVSPATVRILLTGYADLDAIEGSINVGEVFRFLSKPCPPSHLKETIRLAVEIAGSAAAPAKGPRPVPQPAPKIAPDAGQHPTEDIGRAAEQAVAKKPSGAPPEVAADEIDIPFDETIPDDRHDVDSTANRSSANNGSHSSADMSGAEQIVLGSEPDLADTVAEIVLSSDPDDSLNATGTYRGLAPEVSRVGVIVFSSSDSFAKSAATMLGRAHAVRCATTLVQVTEILSEGGSGVLVTDFVADGRVLRKMIATLKTYLPELITIVISNDRDASEMISLINHGQVFRYMAKPAKTSRFMQNVNAAVVKHIQLRDNPELLQRYQVEDSGSDVPAVLLQFLGRIKGVRRLLLRG